MKSLFNAVIRKTPAERALGKLGIRYERQEDGTIFVPGDIDLSGKGLEALPDLSSVVVRGIFNCNDNNLTTLAGAPRETGVFYCDNNKLTTLEGGPAIVAAAYSCKGNDLVSLKGAPKRTGNVFDCSDNNLTILEHGPESTGLSFICKDNKLASLDGAPLYFHKLLSDFGDFNSWDDVPQHLHVSHERIRQLQKGMSVLTRPVAAPKTAKFRKPPSGK